ncbi:hypothetical protein CKQ84_00080 [Shewanella sp. WE21]|jgi:hypothetical protein|uniref:hypothetical protein n=1 Tax=unclassified Shewanella TaxID=196818 RepID=UPI000CF6F1D7|nr:MULTISPECIES: hypothetical protein [unclassified Shewanella]AVI64401.1 hypothetical protein CKQ84_00080 [Shewanella sp. WE21]
MTSILFDQNIISYGDIMTSVRIDGVLGYVRKAALEKNSSWLQEEFNCLPTISKLLQSKKIIGYRYVELELENWQRSGSAIGSKFGNLFPENLFNEVNPAIERSYFFQSFMNEYITTSAMVKFCNCLRNINPSNNNFEKLGLSAEMQKNLRNISRYHELCHVLQKEEQFVDAFHLWSAEVNDIEYFLTTDQKFMNAIKNAVGSCQPILPTQLLNKLGVSEKEPFSFELDVFYGIGGNVMWRL